MELKRKGSFDTAVRRTQYIFHHSSTWRHRENRCYMYAFGVWISRGAKTFLNGNCPRSALHSNLDKSKRICHSGMTAWRKATATRGEQPPSQTHHVDPTSSNWQAAALGDGKKKAQLQQGCYQLTDKMCWAIQLGMRRRNSCLQHQAIMALSGQFLEGTCHIAIPRSLSLSTQHAFRKFPN